MKRKRITLPKMSFVGLPVRTSYKLEQNTETAKIQPLVKYYSHSSLPMRTPNRVQPGVFYSIYTDYVLGQDVSYTYFIGEQVESVKNIPDPLKCLTIPGQLYNCFTFGPGPMPDILLQAWKKIDGMTPQELGGKRAFNVDFEVYDKRSLDPKKTIIDIYISTIDLL